MKKIIKPSANVKVVKTSGIAVNSSKIIKKYAIENLFVQLKTDSEYSIAINRDGRIHPQLNQKIGLKMNKIVR